MNGRWPTPVDVYRTWHRVRDRAFSYSIRRSFASFGEASVIQPPARIYGEPRIAIGSRVFVGAGSWLEVQPQTPGTGPGLVIGDGTSVSGLCVITAAVGVELGRDVLLGRNVHISDHQHTFDDPSLPILAQGVDKLAPVEVGDGAWLGQGVIVTPGVRIGAGAVIAANSVVTTDVPPRTLAAGAPARILRDLD
jgi:acetyltransferase-like isoleucine patch superfamily enzyme